MLPFNKFILRSLLLFFAAFVWTNAISQLKQTSRYEKEYRYHDQDFLIVPLEREGISLIREKNKFKSGKQFWELIVLDTTLQEKYHLELEIDLRNELSGYEYEEGFLHLLFTRKETKGVMGLVSIQLKDGAIQQYEIKPELIFVLTQFCKIGDRFALGGYVNLEPTVLLFTPATNSLKIVPGFFSKDTELIDMRANKNQTLNTLMLENGDRSSRKITLRTFDSSGKELFKHSVNIDEEIVLHNGICSTLELDELVLIGTWGKRNSKQALGYYSIVVNPFGESKINRTYFGGLEHYLDYMKPKRAAKIKARTSELLEKGKLPDFTNHVMPLKITESKKHFLFLSESFIPTREENRNTMSPYSNPAIPAPYGGYYRSNNIYNPNYPSGSSVTLDDDGKTIQGALVAYSPKGTVLWDYSIKLNDVKKPSNQQTIDYYLTDHQVKLMYKKEAALNVKSFDLDTGEATEFVEKIQTLSPGDEIRSDETLGEIRNWYGNIFYAWGYQTIRNRSNPSKTRDVFYVNKVVVD
jgi:hypothetical protein